MKRNKHALSYYKLATMNMGNLVPVGLMEVLPGDTVQQATSALIRVSPLLAPVMHPVHCRIHHWFVPHRLVWEDWEKFITGGPDGLDASELPKITVNPSVGSLADYLGLTTGTSQAVSALPFRGYAKIWNEFYRDQDLQTELTIDKTSGADTTTNTTLQSICWEKDYFTSARPWEQKGAEISVPLGSTAPVRGDGSTPVPWVGATSGSTNRQIYSDNLSTPRANYTTVSGTLTSGENMKFSTDNSKVGLETDLSSATAASINELREAFALQRYQEARARYGSRYTEYLRYLGVSSSDSRLQRPEYLGGGKQTIQFSEVLQTGVTTDGDDTEGVGNLKGHGIGALRSNRYRKFFEEHGYVFTFMSCKPKTIYANGTARHWLRSTKEEFWQRELQHIGQQALLNKEVYAAHGTPSGTFGYQDRYDEYRRNESSIAGEFRSTLDFWHMARMFTSDPSLNSSFVSSNPTNRIYASTATHQLYVMANHSIQARRLVAKNGSSFIY